MATGTKTKTKAPKAAPVEDEVELDELEAEADGEGAVVKDDEVWGVRNGLIPLLKEKTGKEYSPREVRTLLRSLARSGAIEREIVAGNKARYEWTGADDPEIKAIVKAVKGGKIEEAKKAALAELKAKKAKQTAAKGEAAPAKSKTKATKTKAAAPAPVEDDDEDEDDEDDDD